MRIEDKKLRFLRCCVFFLTACVLCKIYAATQEGRVLKVVMEYYCRPSQAKNSVIFLSVNGHDPSSWLQGALGKSGLPVVPQSRGTVATNDFGVPYLVDILGRQGGSLDLASVTWQGPFRVQVKANTVASGQYIIVSLTPDGWTVTDQRLAWIS